MRSTKLVDWVSWQFQRGISSISGLCLELTYIMAARQRHREPSSERDCVHIHLSTRGAKKVYTLYFHLRPDTRLEKAMKDSHTIASPPPIVYIKVDITLLFYTSLADKNLYSIQFSLSNL